MRKKCLDMVHELARKDDRVVFIGSDLGFNTLNDFREELPNQFFVEGISEQNVVGMAAGMALEGRIPYINTIATFFVRRALEQIAMDLCLHDLPVRLIGNGGGVVYAPLGSTHLAVEDIALMRSLPNMTIVCPADAEEMERFMNVSVDWPHPIYIRLAKGYDPLSPIRIFLLSLAKGRFILKALTCFWSPPVLDSECAVKLKSLCRKRVSKPLFCICLRLSLSIQRLCLIALAR